LLDRLLRAFRKKHPELYEALVEYAKKRGVKVTDVLGSAVASYLSADEEGKAELEKVIASKAYTPMGVRGFQEFMDIFKTTANAMVEMMVSIQKAGQELVRGSLLNELKSNIETIEEIKKIGAEGGKGGFEEALAEAAINLLLGRAGAVKPSTKPSGTGSVKEIVEEKK
jgi:hypothetical protein